MAEIPQDSYKISSPLLSCIPQTALDAVYGATALVDAEKNLSVLSRNWNEFMARSGRSDLAKNSILGSSLLSFFRDEQQKRVFCNLLESMANDELGTHNQVVDLGSKESPFYVQFHVHPLWKDGVLIGYLLHCIDTTKEHANRLTLIDHDRQLLQLREMKENYESELTAAKELLGSAVKEQEDKDKTLKAVQEKATRKEKALKAAIKQAELSANNMASKDRELEALREEKKKLDTELSEAREQIDKYAEELSVREEELSKLVDQVSELQSERDKLNEELESFNELDSDSESKLKQLEQTQSDLIEKLEALEAEKQELLRDLDLRSEKIAKLQSSCKQLEKTLENSSEESAQQKTDSDERLHAIMRANTRHLNTLDALSSPVCWMTPDGTIKISNQAFRDYFELDADAISRVSFPDLFSDDDVEKIESLLEDPFSSDCIKLRIMSDDHDGPFCLTPQFEDGQFIGCVGVGEQDATVRESSPETSVDSTDSIRGIRSLSADLAEAFGDLLTAVVGHASLAASEVESDSPTLSDIRAIEESAGEAANLVRKLHALSGKSRSNSVTDLNSAIRRFAKKHYQSFEEDSDIRFELPENKAAVPTDHATLDIILRGIASHVDQSADTEFTPLWKVTEDDNQVKLSVSYHGDLVIPNGWFDQNLPAKDEHGYELYFAREAARAFGGRLEIHDLNSAQELVLWLPLANSRTEA